MKTRRFFGLMAAALMMMVPVAARDGGGSDSRLKTNLTGARINNLTPSGHAEFRAGSGRTKLNVEVEDVSVGAGTILDVYVDGNRVGGITIESGILGGELELNSGDGDLVPRLSSGSVVVVKMGDKGIVAGVF